LIEGFAGRIGGGMDGAEGLPDQRRYPAEGVGGGIAAEYRGGPEPVHGGGKMPTAPENQHDLGIHIYAHKFFTPWWKLDIINSFTMV
jgi:hypothetical protein